MEQNLNSGQSFGPFLILNLIGAGKYSEVFKIQRGDSVFALKKIKNHFKYDSAVTSTIIAEANLLGLIKDSRHFPIFYEAGEIEESQYILMEYIQGLDLKEMIHQSFVRQQKLSWQEACALTIEICQGLEYLHSLNGPDGEPVIHKDIKPSNILINEQGEVKLIDLGLRHTTFKYLPLERLERKVVTPYSDIFATGNIFYEILHGQSLFKSDNEMEIYFEMKRARFNEESFDPSLPLRLRGILARSVNQFSEDRFQTIREFKDELVKILNEEGNWWDPSEVGKKIVAYKAATPARSIVAKLRLQKTDADGFLVNDGKIEKIRPPWNLAVEAIKKSYLKNLPGRIHSIYLRGSVPRGEAIEGISDIDSLAVIHGDPDSLDISWIQDVEKNFHKEFPFCPYVEFDFVPYEHLLDDLGYFSRRFIIKALSVCIYGEDLAAKIPNLRPSIRIAFFLHGNISQVLAQAVERIQKSFSDNLTRSHCTWVMKRILRTGFCLTIEKERAYTRDLYSCYEIFSKYYPEQEPQMRQALEWAINPTSQKIQILDYIHSFGGWLTAEARRTFLES